MNQRFPIATNRLIEASQERLEEPLPHRAHHASSTPAKRLNIQRIHHLTLLSAGATNYMERLTLNEIQKINPHQNLIATFS